MGNLETVVGLFHHQPFMVVLPEGQVLGGPTILPVDHAGITESKSGIRLTQAKDRGFNQRKRDVFVWTSEASETSEQEIRYRQRVDNAKERADKGDER